MIDISTSRNFVILNEVCELSNTIKMKMNKDKIFMVTIHIVAGVLMIAVCWTPAIVGGISLWNKLFCTLAIILLLRFHYWCQQYEP